MKISVNLFELCSTMVVMIFGVIVILLLTQSNIFNIDKIAMDSLVVLYVIMIGMLRFKKIFKD